jgi:uncharacterized protein involved in exopolysaccharide biosynthesis
MQTLTDHEKKILELVKKHPEILDNPAEREKIAKANSMTEKTLRNRIADLKRYGLVQLPYDKEGETRALVEGEINFLDYAKILWKWKKLIIINVIIVTFFSTVISLIMPKAFKSSTALMPPVSESGVGILGALSNLPMGSFLSKADDETMSFIAILKSRTVMENVIDKHDLVYYYGVENIEEALKSLENNVQFEVEDEGTIRISTNVATNWFHPEEEEEIAKKLSADIANYFVEQLDVVNKGQKTQQASFQRMFIGERYRQNIEDLKNAEDRLKTFQEKHKMVSLQEQTKAAIETAATIKGQILSNEVQLGVMKSTLNPGHPDIERVRKEIEELQLQLREMNYGHETSQSNQDKLFPVFSEVPELGVQLLRLKRDVEIQNTLFIFLTQQYEEAKIQEAKDTPTVQVLDWAVEPEKKDKPRIKLILLASVALSFMGSIFYIFLKI